jgi:hypothetical protein
MFVNRMDSFWVFLLPHCEAVFIFQQILQLNTFSKIKKQKGISTRCNTVLIRLQKDLKDLTDCNQGQDSSSV